MRQRFTGSLFAEFRHDSWMNEEVFDFSPAGTSAIVASTSRRWRVSCLRWRLTTDVAYVRFHGRNERTGGARTATASTTITVGGNQEWQKKIHEAGRTSQKTYVFFNNCHAVQAARAGS
jgi:uncharacterized protein YecE (DUF72 family)